MNFEEKAQFITMQKQINALTEKVDAEAEKSEQMRKHVTEIYNVIVDNDMSKTKGIVSRIQDVENDLKIYKRWKYIFAGIMIGLGATVDNIIQFLKKYLLFVLVFLFTGCLSVKKREDITYRYLRDNPKVLADLAQLHFPPVVKEGSVRIDTLVNVQYVYKRDTLSSVESRVDTVFEKKVVRINVTKTDTIYDVARHASLEASVRDLKSKLDVSMEKERKSHEKADKLVWWLIGLGVFLLVVVVLVFRMTGLASRIGKIVN